MILEPVDRSKHLRERRRRARRRTRMRQAVAVALLVAVAGGAVLTARATVGGEREVKPAATPAPKPTELSPPRSAVVGARVPPLQMRGVHVTMALASLPGKLEEYLDLPGLNAIELDIKDENGEVAVPVPLARRVGAAVAYYDASRAIALARKHGVYVVGRVVCFEDPILSEKRPDLAILRRSGAVWRNHAGLGWTNPYRRQVWKYNVDIAVAAAKAGFDEIQFDYVRFPSDGEISDMVFPGKTATPPGWVIAEFLHYASRRLKQVGVRVSADVFGLAATRDLGIGQVPRRIARYVDAIYPMVYPSHYRPGEYNLPDPNAAPRETVAASLRHFERELEGLETAIIPWLQDFSYGRTYTFAEVKAQIDAALAAGSPGFLLWNPEGKYTVEALTYAR
jgi:hypothetical protein